MNILHIFQAFTGDAASAAIPVTGVFAVLFSIFFFQAKSRAQKAGGKWYKQNMAKYLPAIVGFWLVSLALIWNDYRPYNPKRDGVPRVQTDSTRISADSMIKLQQKK